MAVVVFTFPSKISEQTVKTQERKVRSRRRNARLLRLWRRACIVVAEWYSRARQRDALARLNDHLLADVGFMREKQIVDCSKLFCWFP